MCYVLRIYTLFLVNLPIFVQYKNSFTHTCFSELKTYFTLLLHTVLLYFCTDGTYPFSLVGKPSNQSSVYQYYDNSGGTTSDKAIDGNNNTEFRDGYCTQTNRDGHPWWAVDLEAFVSIFSVTITTDRRKCNIYITYQRCNVPLPRVYLKKLCTPHYEYVLVIWRK